MPWGAYSIARHGIGLLPSTYCDEALASGSLIRLKAGDVMVQRGTIHNWVNRGSAPCLLAVVLIDAKSVEAGGKVLPAQG